MDLSTKYLNIDLRTPLVAGASPLSDKIDNIKKLEDAGASAIVFYSLFEEQLVHDQKELLFSVEAHSNSNPEAQSYMVDYDIYRVGPENYLKKIQAAKESTKLPIIGSLNGVHPGSWTNYAKLIQQAGADAIELNIYNIIIDSSVNSEQIEKEYIEIFKSVKSEVSIPVAVKISPYFTNIASFCKKLIDAGAEGLVLFNRFYQPDIDLDALEINPKIALSNSEEMRLPLTWIGILRSSYKNLSLAASTGVHSAEDVLKMMMAGADCTYLVSTLLRNGIFQITKLEQAMVQWMEEKEYESINQMKGSMCRENIPNPEVYERTQYIKSLSKYQYLGQ